jgi:hypothetical protein
MRAMARALPLVFKVKLISFESVQGPKNLSVFLYRTMGVVD